MPRLRTAKAVASRIDLTYHKRLHPLRGARLILSLLCVVGAIAWWGVSTWGGRGMYNPGQLTAAHAFWQNDCKVCHVQDGKGGFFRSVSDNACLQCHDAGIHAEGQGLQFVSERQSVPAMVAGRPGYYPARSADCTHCHTEHKGHQALAAASDQHCVQCHANLEGQNKPGTQMAVDQRVTGFTIESHPYFGRRLLPDGAAMPSKGAGPPRLVDPTVLKFNHQAHMDKVRMPGDEAGKVENCSLCHTTRRPDPLLRPLTPDTKGAPPWALPPESPEARSPLWGAAPDTGYMQPISYEQHCKGCHAITAPGNESTHLPHAAMAEVRGATLALPASEWEWLAPKPKARSPGGPGGLPPRPGGPPPRPGGGLRPPRVGDAGASRPDDPIEQTWFIVRPPPRPGAGPPPAAPREPSAAGGETPTANTVALDKIEKIISRGIAFKDPARKDQIRNRLNDLKEAVKPPPTTQPSDKPGEAAEWEIDERVKWFYAAYLTDEQCAKCHDLRSNTPDAIAMAAPSLAREAAGDAPADASPAPGSKVAGSAAAGSKADEMQASGPPLRQIVPTLVPDSPRRWFVNSAFDHRGHRNMTCLSCHANAPDSKETSDLLSPNLTWETGKGTGATSMHSCVECHHPPSKTSLGAGSNCQMCHVYHDRSKEIPPTEVAPIGVIVDWAHPGGGPVVPATRPTAAAPSEPPTEPATGPALEMPPEISSRAAPLQAAMR